MNIYLVDTVSVELEDAFKRLIPQLSETARIPDKQTLLKIVGSDTTRLFVAEENGKIVGTSSLVIYEIPAIRKAWIEDVVVDASVRGRGVAAALIQHILEYAKEEGLEKVDLTSSIHRKAAYRLYEKLGFEQRESTVFRKTLK